MLMFMTMIDSEEERSKMEIIYKRYHNLMFYIARDMLGNDSEAEDAVQEAFLHMIQINEKITEPESHNTKSLCVIIVKRVAIDMLRKRFRRAKDVSFDTVDAMIDDPSAADKLEAAAENADLSSALKSLSERDRDILELRFKIGLSYREISEVIQISEANARQIVSRACERLRITMTGKEDA
jgi:RNA polymerase sigma-70 factor (ECF subfamily)